MRVLITGASGVLGSLLSEALLARGDEVVGLSRSPDRARAAEPRVEWHHWEPDDGPPPAAAFERVDGVVNLIGESLDQRWTEASKPRMRETRVDATRKLVATLQGLGVRPKVLVSQAAVGYYGHRGDDLLPESEPPGADFAATLVRDWEAAAQPAAELGVRVVTVRSGLVMDPESGLLKRLLLPFKLGVGGPLGGGDWYMPWVHRDDEIALLIWALDDEAVSGPINSVAPQQVTNAEFSKALGRALGRPAFFPAPKLAVRVLYGSEAADAFVASIRVVPERATELGFRFRHPEIDEALKDLVG